MSNVVVVATGLSLSFLLMFAGLWFTMHVDRRLKAFGCLLGAVGAAAQVVMDVMVHNELAAFIMTSYMAVLLYMWWNNGGGDGMKRRLKNWSAYLGFGPKPAAQSA